MATEAVLNEAKKKLMERLGDKYVDKTPKKPWSEEEAKEIPKSKDVSMKKPWEKTDQTQERFFDKVTKFIASLNAEQKKMYFLYIGLIIFGALLFHFMFRVEAGTAFDRASSR